MTREEFWKDINDWSNHRIGLWYALEETKTGDVCEYGLGGGSTPYLHDYCQDNQRVLYSFETDAEWIKQFSHLETENHKFIHVTDWDMVKEICPEPTVVLIDSAPGERRIVDAVKLKDIKGILTLHDTQPKPNAGDYRYETIWHLFKYVAHLQVPMNDTVNPPDNRTWMSCVSNHFDVTQWKGLETGNPDYKII